VSILVHIIGREDWDRAVASGSDHRPDDVDQVGFIHLSTPEQVLVPANRFHAGRTDLVLLVIDPDRLAGEVRWEEGVPPEGDLRFPHLYGPLELHAVREVIDFPPGPDGRFQLPERLSASAGTDGSAGSTAPGS
jgi:uncharacterized protein (DUF952 family)